MNEDLKNIETCRAEDLAAQVQDANPGNFAIEQEVAQLVGATVPQPTQPSADDARELGAQLLVFLRRALTPIQTALRTAVAAIYAHLDSRCTDYTPAAYDPFRLPAGPYDPMRPFVPRTLPNLLTALTAFPDRKISGVPEAADGLSILHLLCTANSYTELRDDNSYTITKAFPISLFQSVETFTFGDNVDLGIGNIISGFAHDVLTVHGLRKQATQSAFDMFTGSFKKLYCDIREIDGAGILFNHETIEEMYLPKLEKANCIISWNASGWWNNCSPNITTIQAPKLKEVTANYGTGTNANAYKSCLIGAQCPLITSLEFEELESISGNLLGGSSCPNITELRMPKLKSVTGKIVYGNQANRASLALIEVGAMETNLDLSWWNPTDKGTTFLQNFREHIALRLTANGSGKTLTLSQAVRNAIHAAESTYGIENIIVTQKGWTISPAPN